MPSSLAREAHAIAAAQETVRDGRPRNAFRLFDADRRNDPAVRNVGAFDGFITPIIRFGDEEPSMSAERESLRAVALCEAGQTEAGRVLAARLLDGGASRYAHRLRAACGLSADAGEEPGASPAH